MVLHVSEPSNIYFRHNQGKVFLRYPPTSFSPFAALQWSFNDKLQSHLQVTSPLTHLPKASMRKKSEWALASTWNGNTTDILTLTPSARKQKQNSLRPIRVMSGKTVLPVSFFFFISFFNVDASPAHVLLFCSSCWMYYSVILKPDKGEVGMLEIAGDFFSPACQWGWEKEGHGP